ncbi:17017_t:CDS:2, partial [Dentiscutata erythropus]
MTRTRTLKQKIIIHPGRVRRPRLNIRSIRWRYYKQAEFADNSQESPVNNDLKDSEDVLINNDLEDSNEDDDFENSSTNNNNLENDYVDDNFENTSINNDDLRNSSDDLEDILVNNVELEDSNDDFEDNISDFENRDNDFSINNDSPYTQKIEDFQSHHAPENVKRLRSQRTRMFLLNIKSHYIPIDNRKTPSTSKQIKPNQLERRFGRIEAIISFLLPSNLEHPNDQMQDALKMSRFLKYDELGIHCSQDRSRRGYKELWIVEEDYQIIPLSYILKPISIWFENVLKPVTYDFHVSEILYQDPATKRIHIRLV